MERDPSISFTFDAAPDVKNHSWPIGNGGCDEAEVKRTAKNSGNGNLARCLSSGTINRDEGNLFLNGPS